MAEYHNIKWQRKDYSALIKAVNSYNKRIKELEKMDLAVALPDVINYKDIKKDIFTRQELNSTIKELSRSRFKNAFDIIKLDNNKMITRYEYNQLNKYSKRANKYLEDRIKEERRNLVYKGLKNDEIVRLESTLKSIRSWNTNQTSRGFSQAIDRIKRIGSLNYENKRASNFRENFMKLYDANMRGYKGYKEFRERLSAIKDPKEFYDYIKQSDFLQDAFLIYYHDKEFSKNENFIYGSFDNNEQAFINTLENTYGIYINE